MRLLNWFTGAVSCLCLVVGEGYPALWPLLIRALIPFLRLSSPWLITSQRPHLLIPSHWELGEDHDMQNSLIPNASWSAPILPVVVSLLLCCVSYSFCRWVPSRIWRNYECWIKLWLCGFYLWFHVCSHIKCLICLHMTVSYRFSLLLVFALNMIAIFDLVSLGKINALEHVPKLGIR